MKVIVNHNGLIKTEDDVLHYYYTGVETDLPQEALDAIGGDSYEVVDKKAAPKKEERAKEEPKEEEPASEGGADEKR